MAEAWALPRLAPMGGGPCVPPMAPMGPALSPPAGMGAWGHLPAWPHGPIWPGKDAPYGPAPGITQCRNAAMPHGGGARMGQLRRLPILHAWRAFALRAWGGIKAPPGAYPNWGHLAWALPISGPLPMGL